ncbi:MAG: PHP domain-containing protein [Cellulosilyticum sp.]|nr:PHP domain-containing protein [Cellulosilyticum sp.]
MKWAYDLHIHTAASPCSDDNMTPHNIVNMSLLKGLQLIAITDHQTVANCEAVMKVGKEKGLQVLAGIEIECMEEFHLIALFQDLQTAYVMEEWLWESLPTIYNRPSIFGHQWKFNAQDEIVSEISRLLLVAARLPAYDIIQKARSLGALIYPAHIDRASYSILSNLGSIPTEYYFDFLEVSKKANIYDYQKQYPHCTILQSSDAHYLEDILEKESIIEVEKLKLWKNKIPYEKKAGEFQ